MIDTTAGRKQMQEDVAAKRKLRDEFWQHLESTREEVCQHMQNLSNACIRERRSVASGQLPLEGQLGAPFALVQDGVKRMQTIDASITRMNDEIEDMIQTLADEEVWK